MTASPPAPTIRLGYWAIRGLAQPIRTLLRHLGVPFEDELFVQGDGPSYSREAWLSVKAGLEIDFANLPYLIDGEVRMTQSQAILRYVARVYGGGSSLYGGSPARLAAIDATMEQAVDFRQSYTRVAYGSAPLEPFASTIMPGYLAGFERVLARAAAGGFICGELSIADFALAEVLDGVQTMLAELAAGAGLEKDAFKAFPQVAAYKARFDAVVAPGRAAANYMARPFNNKVAVWK